MSNRFGPHRDAYSNFVVFFAWKPYPITMTASRPSTFSRPRRAQSPVVRRQNRRSMGRLHAFTLLELLLVLAILVVIGGIVTVNIGGANTEAKVNATKAQLNSLKSNIEMYQIRMNGLPETLEALRDGPSDASKKAKWIEPIIDSIPTDAWENSLTYSVNGNTYEIRSGGIDGQINTDDDLVVEGS